MPAVGFAIVTGGPRMYKHLAVGTATFTLTCVGTLLIFMAPASADDGPVLVADTADVTLVVDDKGKVTAGVTLENQSGGTPEVSAEVGAGAAPGCTLSVDQTQLAAHRQQKVTVRFTACEPDRKDGTGFFLTAGSSRFELHANPPTEPDPQWGPMRDAYLWSMVGVFFVLLFTWAGWRFWKASPTSPTQPRTLLMSLHGLDADWKFSDSWAANATVVTALFTGIFGAKEVAAALVGDGADDLLAVALVSAAVSVGLAGLSPMVLQASRRRFPVQDPPSGSTGAKGFGAIPAGLYVTPLGLLTAAFLTLTATVGQLASIVYAVWLTKFVDGAPLVGFAVIGGVLISWYAIAATVQNLSTGAALPPAAEKKDDDTVVVIDLGGQRFGAGPVRNITEDSISALSVDKTLTIRTPAAHMPKRRPAAIL